MDTIIPRDYIRVHNQFLTKEESKEITEILFREEQTILDLPNTQNNSYYSGLTQQFNVYNWLNNPAFAQYNIPQRIFNLPEFENKEFIIVQCWANILRYGEELGTHIHALKKDLYPHKPSNFYACNLFLSGPTHIGTTIENTHHENSVGELTILSAYTEHRVPINSTHTPRVSLALDIYFERCHYHLNETEPKRFSLYERNTD